MTAFPSLRSFSTSVPNSQSSNTMTSAQSLWSSQRSTFSTKPSPTSRSAFDMMWYLTSYPSFWTCQARSWMRANLEMNRKRVAGGFGVSFGASAGAVVSTDFSASSLFWLLSFTLARFHAEVNPFARAWQDEIAGAPELCGPLGGAHAGAQGDERADGAQHGGGERREQDRIAAQRNQEPADERP